VRKVTEVSDGSDMCGRDRADCLLRLGMNGVPAGMPCGPPISTVDMPRKIFVAKVCPAI